MYRLFRYIVRDPLSLFYAVFLLGLLGWLLASEIGDGIDWLDRRACRVGGGHVVDLEHHEWRCAKPEAR